MAMVKNLEFFNEIMEEDRKESRFIKSYKYKHKPIHHFKTKKRKNIQPTTSCDFATKFSVHFNNVKQNKSTSISTYHQQNLSKNLAPTLEQLHVKLQLIMVILLSLLIQLPQTGNAFCPFKCLCDDQSLSANCTQVPSITIIPMTFNPLLKQLTLNHLPMTELSNSLSVYRRLEYLNLNSNLLRQIKYQNFNFKPAPTSVLLGSGNHHYYQHQSVQLQQQEQAEVSGSDGTGMGTKTPARATNKLNQFELTNSNNEQLARNLKQAIDKSISQSAAPTATIGGSEDEIRLHLRDMDLGDNRIDQLGSLDEFDEEELSSMLGRQQQQQQHPESTSSNSGGGNFRIKSHELERLAPFLTLTRLENLNLSGNRLIKLHQHVFLGLVNLKRLDLSRNQLEFIDRLAFVGLIELELLKLNHNKLASHLQPMSLAFCRAPMMELRFLDLSNNHKSSINYEQDVLLPNQMFICAPRLVSLRLDSLQLRYIQVNAFDNLQQLETLNLSQNYLEQVPSDSLSYSNSNLSQSLRQLDLSDNLIEFVNARSFGALRNLQKLCLNSMARLVSFDLFSLSVHYQVAHNNDNAAEAISSDDQTSKNLLLWQQHGISAAVAATSNAINYPANYANLVAPVTHGLAAAEAEVAEAASDHTDGHIKTINHGNEVQLINDQLIELQLKHNPRLQSLHSSLAVRSELPRGRIRFTKLRLLDLHGGLELRDFNLDEMMDLDWSYERRSSSSSSDNLQVDLSQVSKLNCSSCQMSWLVEAAKQQLYQHDSPFNQMRLPKTSSQQQQQQQNKQKANKISLLTGSIGCSWPFAMPLVQLIELETSYAPIFNQNCTSDSTPLEARSLNGAKHQQQPIDHRTISSDNNGANGSQLNHELSLASESPPHMATAPGQTSAVSPGASFGSLTLATLLLLVVLVIVVVGKLVLLSRYKSRFTSNSQEFKWRSPSLAASSLESPSSSNNHPTSHSPADCSSSSILSSSAAAAAAMANGLYGGHKQLSPMQLGQQFGVRKQQQYLDQHYERSRQLTATTTTTTRPSREQKQLLEQLNNQLIIDGLNRNNVCAQMDGCRSMASASNSTAATSSVVVVVAGGGNNQIEWAKRAHRRNSGGNLFSRIVGRLSNTSWRPMDSSSLANGADSFRRVDGKLAGPIGRFPSMSAESYSTGRREGGATSKQFGTRIIDNVVYGGCSDDSSNNKILANYYNNIPANETSNIQSVSAGANSTLFPAREESSNLRCGSRMPTGGIVYHSSETTQEARERGAGSNHREANFIKPAYCQRPNNFHLEGGRVEGASSLNADFVYANCDDRTEGASSGLIMEEAMETTSCWDARQMMVKQLGAIEMDPSRSSILLDSPMQHQQRKHLQQQHQSHWNHSDGYYATCPSDGQHQQQQQQSRYGSASGSSGQGSSSAAGPHESHQFSATNSQVQPIYLAIAAAAAATSVGNNNSSQLFPSQKTLSLTKSAAKTTTTTATGTTTMAAQHNTATETEVEGGKEEDPLLVDSGGHIYVTLDRPIKQQNGCDEYGRYEQPQQQQQAELELERLKMQSTTEKLEGCFRVSGANRRLVANCPARVKEPAEEEEEAYKSFEWSVPFSRPVGFQTEVEPLEGGDKFKLGRRQQREKRWPQQQQEEVGIRYSEVDCRQRQLVGQLGGKLSSSLQKFEGNIRQQQQSQRGPLPELPLEATELQKGWQFARVSPVQTSVQATGHSESSAGVNSGGQQMYDNSNSNHNKNGYNSDFPGATTEDRKSKNKFKRLAEQGTAVVAVDQATDYDNNVTGHTDCHDDDDDDVAQRAPNDDGSPDQQLNGERQEQQQEQQQLFMDLNSSSSALKTTTPMSSSRDSKWVQASATSSSLVVRPEGDVTMSLDDRPKQQQACPGKYDANHGLKTTTNVPISSQGSSSSMETANLRMYGMRLASVPSDNSNSNCGLINGLQQHGKYVEQNCGPREKGQMGVDCSRPKASPSNTNNGNNNWNNNNNNNNITSSSGKNGANFSSPSMIDHDDEEEEEEEKSMILIGKQNFAIARGSSNCPPPTTDNDSFPSPNCNGQANSASDYYDLYSDGQQELCDISITERASQLGLGGGGAMIRGSLRPLKGSFGSSGCSSGGGGSGDSSSTTISSPLASSQPTNNNGNCVSSTNNNNNSNEIYSNQFYYCKPTLTRPKPSSTSNETSGSSKTLNHRR